MNNKLSRIHAFLDEIGADWLFISDSVECRYITGLQSSNMYLLISDSEQHLFTDFRYKEMAENYCGESNWTFHQLSKSISEELAALLDESDHVAIQSNMLSLDQFEQLEKYAPSVEFLRAGREISALFSAKEQSEINEIAKAASIADKALVQWTPKLTLGISEREAANLLEHYCREGGSSAQSFDTIVLFGERAALPHGVPGERTLCEGDSILVDFGCVVNGFCSDMTRTFYKGSVSDSLKERYDVTLKAQRAGVAALKPGLTAADIDSVVRTIITDAGWGDYFGHGTGHGVGLRIHEHPSLSAKDHTVLEVGMVVTVEPGIYVPNEGGVRIEDLLVITEDGCRSLSQSERHLQVL